MDFENLKIVFNKLTAERNHILSSDINVDAGLNLKQDLLLKSLDTNLAHLNDDARKRLLSELDGFGPIQSLIEDEHVTEILINQFDQIFFEKNGKLTKANDTFFDKSSYHQFIEKICNLCKTYINSEKPFIETQLNNLRLTILFPEICRGEFIVSIRKQPLSIWTLQKLLNHGWASDSDFAILNDIITSRKNFLIVGGTDSGKTSFLQSVIHEIADSQRLIIIEDTQELHPVHPQNTSLLTRADPTKKMIDVTMNDLIKKALRLRPDRICVGEIRGEEATALLMALATGHDGSFGSIHARTAHEALLRLEMLIQMGAPQWSLQSIRRLIGLTIQNIIVVEKKDGKRQLQGIYQITSVEENGITLHKVNEE